MRGGDAHRRGSVDVYSISVDGYSISVDGGSISVNSVYNDIGSIGSSASIGIGSSSGGVYNSRSSIIVKRIHTSIHGSSDALSGVDGIGISKRDINRISDKIINSHTWITVSH